MALRQIRLRKQIGDLRNQLAEADKAAESLVERRNALLLREKELEEALEETTEQTSEEDRAALDSSMDEYENDLKSLETDEETNGQERKRLQDEINKLQAELDELDARSETATRPKEERKVEHHMPIENRRQFFGMSHEERSAFFARDDIKNFVKRLREFKMENRAVNGAKLLIPDRVLGLVRGQVYTSSKLLKYVTFKTVPGTSRMIISGTIPEAIWTEMCATLNELVISFNSAELDGYKVGGYFAVCNAVLADADEVDLTIEFVTTLAAAIAKAVDKSIPFGTNVKMPMGIVTRLMQTEKPGDYSATAREWKNLSTTNVVSISAANSTGIKLFQNLTKTMKAANNKYTNGTKFWLMNEATKLDIMVEAMNFTANAAIATGVNNTMPVIGGDIVTIEAVPDGMIVAGYGDCYLMVQREGEKFASSEHVRFIQDETVFKGEARYDGEPVIAEAFVFIGINGVTPSAASVTFPGDKANTPAAGK